MTDFSCRPKKTADFIRDAVETRLRMYIPYIETWPQVQHGTLGIWASECVHRSGSFTWYCLLRRWAYCCFPTTSPTAWSTSPRWWTTSGTTPETDPQMWVDPVTLLLLLLLLIASCPPFITTLKISDLPPPRLLPIDTSLCPCWYTENTCFLLAGRCHLSIYIKTVNDRSSQQIISQILFN